MNNMTVWQAITRIAEHEGITENEVLMEMQMAILERCKNPTTRQMWDKFFGKDTIPGPEEFIAKMVYSIAK